MPWRHPGLLSLVAILLLAAPAGHGAACADYEVRVSATVGEAPAHILLTWPSQAATGFTVSRRLRGIGGYTVLSSLSATATSYDDTTAAVGTVYEYQVAKSGTPTVTSTVTAAIRAPVVDQRGAVVLLVDATMAAPLADGLARLEEDLAGDGWRVIRHDVPRFHVGDAGWKEAVVATKALIAADYAAAPAEVKQVLIIGHVPVPYSGQIAPDGHGDHVGAWPADVYYGDLHGAWTDATINTVAASRNENDNVPGDGKFDQSYVPAGAIELAVGRVDLARMGAFGASETALLQRYLDKDHAFRIKQLTATRRGLIDDNFGEFGGEAFAASGWGSWAALVGHANVAAADWFGTLAANDYLLAYGCGGGSYTSASGVGTTDQFASTTCRTVFTFIFGSYHGDWDSQNNFLRAPLAMPGWGLTCGWSGRPRWKLHQMAVGDPIGVASLAVQDAQRQVHIALMGDPTLRLHACAPVTGLSASAGATAVDLAWTASPDAGAGAGEGYLVYRGSGRLGPFTRLTPSPIAGTAFTDSGVPAGAWRYLVRAVGLETSGTATYLNPSQAAAIDVTVAGTPPGLVLVHPNGGESFTAGSRILVRWSGVGCATVLIDGSTDGGATWTVLTPATANDGAEEVVLPAVASADARLRVRPAGGGAGDLSDGAVTLVAAGSGIWDAGAGAGATGWSTAANWQGDAPPAVRQNVVFPALATTTATIDRRWEVGALTATAGAALPWVFTGGGTLSLRGLTTSGAAGTSFTDAGGTLGLELPVDQTWALAGGTVTVGALPISGPGRLTKRGGPWLVLSDYGANWSGGLRLEQGAVSMRTATALGTGTVAFGTDLGTGLTFEVTTNSAGSGGTIANPLLCDNGRNGSNSNLVSCAGWAGTRTVTFSGDLSTGPGQHPSGRFAVDADSNAAGQASSVVFTGSHAGFNTPGALFEVRGGTVVLGSAAAVVGPDTGYLLGGTPARRRTALLLGTAMTLARPVMVGAASTHADTGGAPTLGCQLASGTATVAGEVTLSASGAIALHLLALDPGATLCVTGAIGDGSGTAGLAIGGMTVGGGTLLTTGTTSWGTVDLAAPAGSTYGGTTRVVGTLQVSNATGSATGDGPLELTGALAGLRVVGGGTGYSTAAVVTVDAPGGSGTTAVGAVAAVNSGVITQMRLTNPGSGYTATPAVAVTVGSGATIAAVMSWGRLTGTGRVAGAVTVGPVCEVAPGVGGIGALATGSLTFQAGSRFAVDLAGAASDRVAITGDLDLSAAETLAVTGAPVAATVYVIATWTGTRTGTFDAVTGIPGGWSVHYDDANRQAVIAEAPPGGGAPEIAVSRSGAGIADGGTDAVADSEPGVTATLAYRIANTGATRLALGAPSLGASTNCTAAVSATPAAAVPAGGWTDLAVAVTPGTGAWSFTVSFATDDGDENPTDWLVSGTATGQPEIAVTRGVRAIADGGSDCGIAATAGVQVPLDYAIANTGSGNLSLGWPAAIGSQANCFVTPAIAPTPVISPGASTTACLLVLPLRAGPWSFTISMACSDADENPMDWTVSGTAAGTPEIAVARGSAIADGAIDAAGSSTFGSPVVLNYLVSNAGSADLTLSGPAQLSTFTNCTAVADALASSVLAPGASTTLAVTVTPAALGGWSCRLSLASDDGDEDPYDFFITGSAFTATAPEIAVTRGGAIADGGADAAPSSTAGQALVLSYAIANTGTASLTLSLPATVAGAVNCSAAVTGAPSATVAIGGSSTLAVTVTPTAAGAWSFTVALANDDADETPFDWTVSGTATPALVPEIAVSRGFAIADGGTDAAPSSTAGQALTVTYIIANAGTATLNLSLPATMAGAVNCSAAVTATPAATIAMGGSATLAVTVTPTAAGAWSFAIALANDDPDENPMDWTVAGTTGPALVPDIVVARSAVIGDGGADAAPSSTAGQALVLSYLVSNAGAAPLAVGLPVTVGGEANCSAAVTGQPAATVAAGGSTMLMVAVTPGSAGAWSFAIAMSSNDPDEDPMDWTVTGSATAALVVPPVVPPATSTGGISSSAAGGCGGGGLAALVLALLLAAGLAPLRRRAGPVSRRAG